MILKARAIFRVLFCQADQILFLKTFYLKNAIPRLRILIVSHKKNTILNTKY